MTDEKTEKAPPVEDTPVADEPIKAETKENTAAKGTGGDLPNMQSLTVEELYDKDKYDLSTMEPGDVFTLLQ